MMQVRQGLGRLHKARCCLPRQTTSKLHSNIEYSIRRNFMWTPTGVSSDTVFLSQRFTDAISVNFGDNNLAFCVRKCISKLLVYRSEVLE
jgi:hypothetical protein